jgi:Leucine-rich repeat (LRR) protein
VDWCETLGCSLRKLSALKQLNISGNEVADAEGQELPDWTAEMSAAASQCLTAAIGSLTGLKVLRLDKLHRLSVQDCCMHLSHLERLTNLSLGSLTGPAEDEDDDIVEADERGFADLLCGLVSLTWLSLGEIDLSDEATALFNVAVPQLTALTHLELTCTQLRMLQCAVLASSVRGLPLLQEITLSPTAVGVDLPDDEEDEFRQALIDLNNIAGRQVFRRY